MQHCEQLDKLLNVLQRLQLADNHLDALRFILSLLQPQHQDTVVISMQQHISVYPHLEEHRIHFFFVQFQTSRRKQTPQIIHFFLLIPQIIIMMIMMLKNWARFSTQIGNQQNNMKRFYKEAHFEPNPNKKHPMHNFLITLDAKTIKTPYRNILAVPSPALAFLLSSQFNRQQKHLKTGEMPILALCRTAVDADIQGHLAQHLKFSIYQYLKTDTLLFHDDTFVKEHQRLAQPLIDNFKQKFDMKIKPSTTLDTPDCQINENFTSWVESLNNWELIGLETMTIWMKSTIAAFSIIDSAATPQDIQTATYLEEVTQMKSSGQVQEKIMDINQIRLMISCGEMLFRYGKNPSQL